MHTPMDLGGRPASEAFVALPVDSDLMFFSFERGTVLGALPLSRVTNGEIDAPGKKLWRMADCDRFHPSSQ